MKYKKYSGKNIFCRNSFMFNKQSNPIDYCNITKSSQTTELFLEKYPIPDKYSDTAVYCRVFSDFTRAFYYDKNYLFLCEVCIWDFII